MRIIKSANVYIIKKYSISIAEHVQTNTAGGGTKGTNEETNTILRIKYDKKGKCLR
jgi:hypothetical protein